MHRNVISPNLQEQQKKTVAAVICIYTTFSHSTDSAAIAQHSTGFVFHFGKKYSERFGALLQLH